MVAHHYNKNVDSRCRIGEIVIRINKNKKAIRIGELVVVKEWKDNKGYVYSDRIGIVMADEGTDANGLEQWGRWHIALENGDYIGCSSNEIEVIEEIKDELTGTGTIAKID